MSYKLSSINSYLFIYDCYISRWPPRLWRSCSAAGRATAAAKVRPGISTELWCCELKPVRIMLCKLVLQLSDNTVLLQSACPQEPRRKRFLWCWQGIHFLIILKFHSQASMDETILDVSFSLNGRVSEACQDWSPQLSIIECETVTQDKWCNW